MQSLDQECNILWDSRESYLLHHSHSCLWRPMRPKAGANMDRDSRFSALQRYDQDRLRSGWLRHCLRSVHLHPSNACGMGAADAAPQEDRCVRYLLHRFDVRTVSIRLLKRY